MEENKGKKEGPPKVSINLKYIQSILSVVIVVGGMYTSHIINKNNTKHEIEKIREDVDEIKQAKPELLKFQIDLLDQKVNKMDSKIDKIYDKLVENPD